MDFHHPQLYYFRPPALPLLRRHCLLQPLRSCELRKQSVRCFSNTSNGDTPLEQVHATASAALRSL